MSTKSKTDASCAVTGNISCSEELSKDTSTSGLEKTSRVEWVAGFGIMSAAAAVVLVSRFTVKASFENCHFFTFSSFLLLLLFFLMLFFLLPFFAVRLFGLGTFSNWLSSSLFFAAQYPIVSLLFSRLHSLHGWRCCWFTTSDSIKYFGQKIQSKVFSHSFGRG